MGKAITAWESECLRVWSPKTSLKTSLNWSQLTANQCTPPTIDLWSWSNKYPQPLHRLRTCHQYWTQMIKTICSLFTSRGNSLRTWASLSYFKMFKINTWKKGKSFQLKSLQMSKCRKCSKSLIASWHPYRNWWALHFNKTALNIRAKLTVSLSSKHLDSGI